MEVFEVQYHPVDVGAGAALGKGIAAHGADIGYHVTDVFIFGYDLFGLGHQLVGGIQVGAFRRFDVDIGAFGFGFRKKFSPFTEQVKGGDTGERASRKQTA